MKLTLKECWIFENILCVSVRLFEEIEALIQWGLLIVNLTICLLYMVLLLIRNS